MKIEIENIEDVRTTIDKMHASEFTEEDFGFDSKNETFFLRSYSSKVLNKERKEFYLEIYNVKKYTPLNLDKIGKGKAITGIFDTIDIGHNGLKLSIITKDLNIVLRLRKLKGILRIKNKK